jgi:flavorubredoxin
MSRALVISTTRKGETEKIANLVAEGIRFEGCEAELKRSGDIKKEEELQGYDALVLGSATYHGDMLPGMKTLLFLAEKAELKGVVGGAFGAFGWSGEAPDRIYDTMKHIFEMKMVSNPLRLKSSTIGGGIQMAQDYGREIAKKMKA